MVGPITFTTENTTKRLSQTERSTAVARMCLERAWPVSVVSAGVPLINTPKGRYDVSGALSKLLQPVMGPKAATILGGCEAPEVLAVISRHLGLGNPELEVAAELEKRILNTYVNGTPSGTTAWQQDGQTRAASLIRRIHTDGQADAIGFPSKPPSWERRGWVKREGRKYVRQVCRCGGEDLAFVPTPEVEGLVCLRCREDRSALVIPESWNTAIADPEYWESLGYD